jgi:AraC-like DNA-binding protein
LEPLPAHSVHVQIAKWFLPDTGVLTGTLCGLQQIAARNVGDNTDDLFLGVNLAGVSVARRQRCEMILRDGDAVLLSHMADGFAIRRPTMVRFVRLRVPRRAISPLVAGLDGPLMRLIPSGAAPLKLLTSYVDLLGYDPQMFESPELCRLVATHIHDLIALSIGARRDTAVIAQHRGVRAARLRAMKNDITVNLGSCELTVTTLAARHRVSPRYVQKLFESEGTTFSEFVLDQRLQRAYRLLTDPDLAGRPISSIAFDVGFGDLSYFNRTFRRRYNSTPSETRCREAG